MRTSDETKNLLAALVAIAPEITTISKNKKAFGYKYATLDSLLEMLRGVLPRFGVWFVQIPNAQNGKQYLTTRVFHASGEWLEDDLELTETELSGSGKNNDTQKAGASITYFRRYALAALFGVASDEDTDANAPTQKRTNETPTANDAAKTVTETAPRKKQTPIEYILNDIKERTNTDKPEESRAEYVAEYSRLLGEPFTDVQGLTAEQAKRLATAIFNGRK